MLKSSSPVDPMYTVLHEGGPYHTRGHLQEYAQRLEQTGRAQGAQELRRRHPNEP